jgi:amino acid transporter/nucleotide-binding universal stress UspA family protein
MNKEEASPEVEIQLSRDLGLLDVTMIGIGGMIGAGIFVLMGSASRVSGSAAIIALALNGLVALITALSYAELGSAYPAAGSVYIWAREGLPPPSGFFSGWVSWIAATIACSLYAVGFGSFIVFGLGPEGAGIIEGSPPYWMIQVIAVLVILTFVFINYFGVETTGKTESWLTAAKVVILAILIVGGFAAIFADPNILNKFADDFVGQNPSNVFLAMGLTLIAFQGYEIVAQSGEEVKNPKRNIPRAIFISIGVVVLLYVLVFFISYEQLANIDLTKNPELAMIRAAGNIIPIGGSALMLAGGLLATTSALNATVYSSSRVSFAMGRDGVIPRGLGKIHPKRRTPSTAVLTSGLIIGLMAVLLPIEQIAASASVMFLLLFTLANACVISLRKKRPDLDRGFRVPFVPVVPYIGIVLNIFLAVYVWFFPSLEGGTGPGQIAWYVALTWILLGLVVHYPTGGRKEIAEIKPARRVELLEVLSEGTAKIDRKKYRVMVPIKGPEDLPLVDMAASLASDKNGELTILNVFEVPKATPLKSVGFSRVSDSIKEMGRLEKAAKRKDIKVHALLKISHDVYDAILRTVESQDANLIVLGWTGGPPSHIRVFGTNIDYLVQKAPSDVVVFKFKDMPEKLESILLLAGHEWHASHAAELAATIAKRHGAKITVFGVVTDASKRVQDERAVERLSAICREGGVETEEKTVRSYEYVRTVVQESRKHDLLVMGASAYWPLRKYVLGPIRDDIAARTRTPILMLRKVKAR